MVDFHCHIDLYADPSHLLSQLDQTNTYVLAVTTTPKAWRGTKALIGQRAKVKAALGLHPQLAHEREQELPLFEALLSETRYVGEVGLDGSKDYKAHLPAQTNVFSTILAYCEKYDDKIISIHSKSSASLVLDVIEQHPNCGTPVFHWFTGTIAEAERAVELGSYFSVNSSMLKSKRSKKTLIHIPKARILTESDGPFIQHENRPSSPLDMGDTVTMLAKFWGEEISTTDTQIMMNLGTLLGK